MAKRSLVPETGGLRVVAIRWAGGGLVIEVEPRIPPQCPRCGAISTSRHGAYIRTLRDLPVQGDAVTLRVHAGRWRCRSSSFVQRTFVAPLTALAYARQRRTRRLDNVAFLVMTAFLFPILLAGIGTRALLYGLVITSILGAIVTWLYRIEMTGVKLDRVGR